MYIRLSNDGGLLRNLKSRSSFLVHHRTNINAIADIDEVVLDFLKVVSHALFIHGVVPSERGVHLVVSGQPIAGDVIRDTLDRERRCASRHQIQSVANVRLDDLKISKHVRERALSVLEVKQRKEILRQEMSHVDAHLDVGNEIIVRFACQSPDI